MMRGAAAAVLVAAAVAGASAQEIPPEYRAVLEALDRPGDFKDGVLKVNVPRSDLKVSVAGVATPTPFGFGGWVAFTRAAHGMDVVMGDLVLTEDEVNPVMSALLDNGIEVTALHNHFFHDVPRMFYLHVHAHGKAGDVAARLKPALASIGRGAGVAGAATASPLEGTLDAAAVSKIIGHAGEQSGAVYKITIGRPDLDVREMGAIVNARMGLNTWAAFYGSDADAVVAGDVAMLESELQGVLKALRSHGIDVVAIHHHMTGSRPVVIFLHYFGRGEAQKLAAGVRAAIDRTAQKPSSR
jgi:hypothetical protein